MAEVARLLELVRRTSQVNIQSLLGNNVNNNCNMRLGKPKVRLNQWKASAGRRVLFDYLSFIFCNMYSLLCLCESNKYKIETHERSEGTGNLGNTRKRSIYGLLRIISKSPGSHWFSGPGHEISQ